MEVKPGYKQTEGGLIPEEWDVKRVGDICGFIVPGRNKPTNFDGDIPWVTMPDLDDGRSVSASRLGLCVSKEEAKNIGSKIVPPGSVLMSCAGELGIVAFTTNEIIINQQLHAFIPSSVIDGTFLLYAIKSQKAHIDGLATKTAVSYLNKYNCNSIPIPFPPLPEQRAIAGALSDVDTLIDALEKLIVKKRDLKQAAMQQLLTGQTRLPGFTEEWQTAQLKSIYATVFKKSPISSSDGVAQGSYLLFVSGGDAKWIDTALYSNTEALIFSDGGVFDVRYFVGDFSVTDHCYVVSLHGDLQFYFYWLSLFKEVLDLMTFKGSGLRNLDKKELGRVNVPVPSATEQTAIAAVLSDMDAEIAALEQRLTKTRALKQGMMQELLTGKTRLIAEPSDIVNVTEMAESRALAAKSHNWEINEAVVISVLTKRFGTKYFPLGRKRYTKLCYLLHRHVEKGAEGYLRKAAGPYNPGTRYKGPEKIAQCKGYIRKHTNGEYSGFIAAEDIGKAEAYFRKWYGPKVLKWLDQFRFMSNDELELLTTVDMAMEDLRKARSGSTLDLVKKVINDHPEWKAKLSRPIFSDKKIAGAMQTCEELFS